MDFLQELKSKALGIFEQKPKPEKKVTAEDIAANMKVTYGVSPDFKNEYNPDFTTAPAPIVEATQSRGVDPSNIQWLEQNVLPITRQAGLPDPLVAGQWAIEDRKKDTSMFNLRIDGKVHKYQNIENNVNDYIYTLNKILKAKGYDLSQIKDPQQILKILQTGDLRFEGHSKDPMDYVKITSETPEYKHYLK